MYLEKKMPNSDKILRYKFVSNINQSVKTKVLLKYWKYNIEVTEYWIEADKAFDGQYYGGMKYKIHDLEDPKATHTWEIWLHGNRKLELNKVYSCGFPIGFVNDPKDHDAFMIIKAMTRANDINTKTCYKDPNTGTLVARGK